MENINLKMILGKAQCCSWNETSLEAGEKYVNKTPDGKGILMTGECHEI